MINQSTGEIIKLTQCPISQSKILNLRIENIMPRNTKKGGITGSKHFDSSNVPTPTNPLEAGKELIEKAAENVQGAANGARKVGNSIGKVNNAVKSVRNAFKGGSSLVTDEHKQALNQATEIAGNYGVELTDIQSFMGASNDDVDSSLGEGISAKEANQRKLIIQRQNNLLDVRLDRIKQKRKIATISKEELGLVGDLVEVATTGVNVASKMVGHQIAITEFHTHQSKLEEKEELLIQQQTKTQGIINLTPGIETEWNLKLELQSRRNEQLEIQIEKAENSNDKARAEAEAMLFDVN
jgi:methionine aminopeptidase